MLDGVDLFHGSWCVWIPDSLAVLQLWTYHSFVASLFDLWIADFDISSHKAKSQVHFGCDVVCMFVPLKVLWYLDAQIFDNIHVFQLLVM